MDRKIHSLCTKNAIGQGECYRRSCVGEGGKPIGMVGQHSIVRGSFRLAKDKGEDNG